MYCIVHGCRIDIQSFSYTNDDTDKMSVYVCTTPLLEVRATKKSENPSRPKKEKEKNKQTNNKKKSKVPVALIPGYYCN